MQKFEGVIYNKDVEKALRNLETHPKYTDDWVDDHYIEIYAIDMQQAMQRLENKYPFREGFVIKELYAV